MTEEKAPRNRIPWPSFFAVEAADLPELPDLLFRVLIVLNMIFARNRYGRFQVSDRRLSEICNVHPDTIKRCVIKLAEFRLISMERKQGGKSFRSLQIFSSIPPSLTRISILRFPFTRKPCLLPCLVNRKQALASLEEQPHPGQPHASAATLRPD